jgi:molybdopterin converting factor small subunit
MKVTVEFLSLPLVTRKLGKKKIDMEMRGATVGDLSREIASKIPGAIGMVLKKDGTIDDDIRVYINGHDSIDRQNFSNLPLKDGDSVTFMLLVAGG